MWCESGSGLGLVVIPESRTDFIILWDVASSETYGVRRVAAEVEVDQWGG